MITNYGIVKDINEESFDMATGIYWHKKIVNANVRRQILLDKKNFKNLPRDKKKNFESMSGYDAAAQEALFFKASLEAGGASNRYKASFSDYVLSTSQNDIKTDEVLEAKFQKIMDEYIDGDILILIPDNGLTSECWANTNKYSIVYTVLDAKIVVGNLVQKDILNFMEGFYREV